MAQLSGGSDWISAFLEWTETDFDRRQQPFAAVLAEADGGWAEESAAIYLEWIDEAASITQRAAAAAPDPLRETLLLMALRAETECMHILRQVLEEGRPDSRALQLAMGALEDVEADVRAISGRIAELRAH